MDGYDTPVLRNRDGAARSSKPGTQGSTRPVILDNHRHNGREWCHLPYVQDMTIERISHKYGVQQGDTAAWSDHVSWLYTHLASCNPNLVAYIETQLGNLEADTRDAVVEIVIGSLAFLDEQIQADSGADS